jgi:hypothetical protein
MQSNANLKPRCSILEAAGSLLRLTNERALAVEVVTTEPDGHESWGFCLAGALRWGVVLGPGAAVATLVLGATGADALEITAHEVAHASVLLLEPAASQAERRTRVAELRKLVSAPEEWLRPPAPAAFEARWRAGDTSHDSRWFRALAHLLWRLEFAGRAPAWPVAAPGCEIAQWRRIVRGEATTYRKLPLTAVLRKPIPRRQARWLHEMAIAPYSE